MIPKKPQGVVIHGDSLASLPAKIQWLRAYARLWLDRYLTEHYGAARLVIGVLLLIVMVPTAYKLEAWLAGHYVPVAIEHGVQVQRAWVQYVVYIVIMIVAALIAYAMAPKPPTPEVQKGKVPDAEDGKSIIRVYGTVWVEDPIVLGFKTMGADPIQKKGGKK